MTLVGLTALSVEIETNSRTPCRSASCARSFVPKTLFLIASAGFDSIIGTCLWAAAWKITAGVLAAMIWSIRCSSVISAISGSNAGTGSIRASSCSMRNSEFSDRSTSRSFLGRKRSTCRQISEPIEPPAPVTITVRPSTSARMAESSSLTGSRRRRSLISTGRSLMCEGLLWPLSNSSMPGSTLTSAPAAVHSSRSCRNPRPVRLPDCTMTSSTPRRATSAPACWIFPSTSNPATRVCLSIGSSSRKPTIT